MPKPIVVIFLPKETTMCEAVAVKQSLEKTELFKEYHVLCASSNLDSFDVKVFYEKDFNEVKYKELKKIIEDSLNA